MINLLLNLDVIKSIFFVWIHLIYITIKYCGVTRSVTRQTNSPSACFNGLSYQPPISLCQARWPEWALPFWQGIQISATITPRCSDPIRRARYPSATPIQDVGIDHGVTYIRLWIACQSFGSCVKLLPCLFGAAAGDFCLREGRSFPPPNQYI